MKYEVKSIDYQDCKEWFLKKHYARRIPPIEFCFGLYDQDILVGVCSYGTPVSSVLRELFPSYKLYELNRLVVSDGLPKNSLSYFVSKTIDLYLNHLFWCHMRIHLKTITDIYIKRLIGFIRDYLLSLWIIW